MLKELKRSKPSTLHIKTHANLEVLFILCLPELRTVRLPETRGDATPIVQGQNLAQNQRYGHQKTNFVRAICHRGRAFR